MAKIEREPKASKGDRKIIIPNARQFDNGNVAFTLCIDEVTIHNCWLQEGKNKDLFVAFPSYKGKDGAWYKYAYTQFTEGEMDEIVKQINELI